MTNNEYLQQQYREDMRSRNWISFNDWVAQRNPQPQRTWVGLTDEEIRKAKHHMVEGAYQYSFKQGAKWAEAQLKEKNT